METTTRGTLDAGTELVSLLADYFGNDHFDIDTHEDKGSEHVLKVYQGERPRPAPDDEEPNDPFHVVVNKQTKLVGVFSNDWFDRITRSHWEKYILPFAPEIRSYLEIGVCEGRSMRWVMENTSCKWATGVDPYEPPRISKAKVFKRYQARVKKNLAPWIGSRRRPRVRLHKAKSFHWLRGDDQPPDQHFDMIYVDGDHRGHLTMLDLTLSWMKLKVGGLMVIDDVNRRWAHSQPSTWEAYRGFELAYDHLFDWVWRTRKHACLRKHHHI